MSKRIAIVQGHPDPAGGHFVHALAGAYEGAAREAGHEVRRIDVARLGLTLVSSAQEWTSKPPSPPVVQAQQAMAWAQHLVVFYPLWLGDMPALVKAFFEQALRPGFAIGKAAPGRLPKKLLAGRSARVVVTMGMPALFYKIYYRAHSLKSLKRNILEACGYSPVRSTVIGMVEGRKETRADWLTKLAALGKQGA
jgi:putative NADPH-quinone reductase